MIHGDFLLRGWGEVEAISMFQTTFSYTQSSGGLLTLTLLLFLFCRVLHSFSIDVFKLSDLVE
jgi:hypothetical protein